MNIKFLKKVILLLLFSFTITSCANTKTSSNGKEEDFNTTLKNINQSRVETYNKTQTLKSEYINWFDNSEEQFKKEELDAIITNLKNPQPCDTTKLLSFNEAKEDIDMLFKLIRYGYGAYGYFGGDNTFLKAKDSLLKEIDENQEIEVSTLGNLINSHLKFVKDGHFLLYYPKTNKVYYMYKDVDFFKNSKGYYKIIEGKSYYIDSINNEKDIDKFMKLTINKEGKLVYAIATLSDAQLYNEDYNANIKFPITYFKNKELISENITLRLLTSKKSKVTFEYSVINNIPISKLGSLGSSPEERKNSEKFAETGIMMKKYPINIVDIRGCGGGYVMGPYNWFYNFSGQNPELRGIEATINSKLIQCIRKNLYNHDTSEEDAFIQVVSNYSNNERIKNDNLVFFLIDNNNGSASDMTIELMTYIDNIILVGTNSRGCTTSLGVTSYILKNSNIPISLASTFYHTPYSDDFEFKGFQPDILVDSDIALERVQKLIEYYKLTDSKNLKVK